MFTIPKLIQETPAEITPTIREALRQLSPSTPFFIEITPLPNCSHACCYGNVDSYVAREGGCREEGWIVYEGWGGRYIKLIHHSLWRKSDGRLMDLTPSDEVRNLFLPDTVCNNGDGVPPRYIALDPSPQVTETIAFCEDMDRQQTEMFRCLLGVGERRVGFDRSSKIHPFKRPCGQGIVGRNDPCPCGSGKKFKRCCLPKA